MEPKRRTTRHYIDHAVDQLKRGDVKALYNLQCVYLDLDNDQESELDEDDRFWKAYALYHFGIALEKYNHHAFALEVFSKCVTRFETDSDKEIGDLVNQALLTSGIIASHSDRFEEAIKHFDHAIDRLQSATSSKDRAVLAKAVVHRAESLLKSGAVQDTITAFANAYARFKGDNDPEVCREIAYALAERARLLGEIAVDDHAASAYADFFFECENSNDPAISSRVFVMQVMMPAGLRSGISSRPIATTNASRQGRRLVEEVINPPQPVGVDEVLAKCDEALQLFGENPEGEDQIWAVRAMLKRGAALQYARRSHEAVAAYVAILERFKNSSDDEVQRLVAIARAEAGTTFGTIGDFDTAVSYLDVSIDEIKNVSHRLGRQGMAHRMFNRATMLRQAGRTEDAVRAFDAIYDRFAADDDPKVCQFVALAVYNKATGLKEAGDRTRAMPALRFAFDHCAESHDSLIKERAARALLALAGEYIALESVDDWATTLHELAVRCGSAAEPAVQEIIGKALMVCPALLTSLPPAAHSLWSDYNRQTFITILEECQDRPDLIPIQMNRHYEFLQRSTKDAEDLHAEAVKVLSAYWLEKKPFAILLRNFASEAAEIVMPVEGKDFPMRAIIQLPIDSAEERIQAAVGSTIPLISISNPTPHLFDRGRIPKLEVRNEIWEAAVKAVIKIAGLILVKLDDVTPGVLTELDAIVNEFRQFSTVVIVSNALKDNELARELKAAQLSGGKPPDNPVIPRFAFVIDAPKLPAEGGEPLVEIQNLMVLNGLVPERASS